MRAMTITLLAGALLLPGCTTPPKEKPPSAAPAPRAQPVPAPVVPPAPASLPADTPNALPPLLLKRAHGSVRQQPQSIWGLVYQGKPAYYMVEACCDRLNTLHDAAGYARCAPSRGTAGRGDGKCPDALPPREQMRLLWQRAE